MLILAGVSLNAIVGDNGIINQAQNTSIAQCCADLSEFLNQEYIKKVGEESKGKDLSALEYLLNTDDISFFQIAINNSPYFLDPITYKKYYFINKSNLPSEIRNKLKGGDFIINGLYADFKDIYGVSLDLKVYYCSNGIDSGINKIEDGGSENLNKPILKLSEDSQLIDILGYNSDVSLSNVKSVQELIINKNGVDLTKLMYFSSLKKIIFTNVSYENLNGIQNILNLNFIYFKNSTIGNYSKIANIPNLNYLYFWKTSDSELIKLCDSTLGIGGKDITSLRYFSISDTGDERSINSTWWENNGSMNGVSKVTNVEPLKNLSNVTKRAITYLTIEKTEVSDLTPLNGFTSVILLVIDNNRLKNLNGIENMSNLQYLTAYSNPLATGSTETSYSPLVDSLKALINLDKLSYIRLGNCTNLVFLDSLKYKDEITTLDLRGCKKLNEDSLYNIRNEIINGGTLIESIYQFAIADENETKSLNLSGLDLTIEQLESIGRYKNLLSLNLNNVKVNGSVDGTKSSEAVNALNSSLLQLNKLVTLNLRNFKGFNDCSKLLNMNTPIQTFEETDPTTGEKVESNRRLYLDLRGTAVNTNSNTTGLQVLNSKQISTLYVNGDEINIVNIQPILNQMRYWDTGKVAEIKDITWDTGFQCESVTSLKTIENCVDLERIVAIGQWKDGSWSMNIALNLSKLTKLKIFAVNHTYFSGGIVFPSSLEVLISRTGGNTNFDVTVCNNLKKVCLDAYTGGQTIWNTMKDKSCIEELCITTWSNYGEGGIPSKMDIIKTLSSLKSLYIITSHWSWDRSYLASLESLSKLSSLQYLTKLYLRCVYINDKNFLPISNLSHLENLTILQSNIEDISFISGLSNLINVTLDGNSINRGFSNFENLVNLKKLSLNNNVIQDVETIDVENEDPININIINILIGLNYNNDETSLEELYISNNSGISDLAKKELNKCIWVDKSGF